MLPKLRKIACPITCLSRENLKKLSQIIAELAPGGHPSGNSAIYSTWTNKGYQVGQSSNKSANPYPASTLDPDIERQQADFVIDQLIGEYPQLIQNKSIKLFQLQMLIGKILRGQQNDQISLKAITKRLKQKGIKIA